MYIKCLDVQELIDNERRRLGVRCSGPGHRLYRCYRIGPALTRAVGTFVGGGERTQEEDEAGGNKQFESHLFRFEDAF